MSSKTACRSKTKRLVDSQKREIVRLRHERESAESIARKVGCTVHQVKGYVRTAGISGGSEKHFERVSHKDGKDLWPMVPYHIRLTERGHGQAVPKAIGT
jgi:hypothetical protein